MNVFGFGSNSNSKSNIAKYIDKLKDDIVIETKSLIKTNPQGYKLTLLQESLNTKYFEYENILKENKVNIKLINQFKTDCFELKELMEENYLKNRNNTCADILAEICTNHSNDLITMDIDDIEETEIQRRFDINYNMLSAKLYNSIGGWTFNDDNQMHNMVKETLDIIKEVQATRLNDIKTKRLQDIRQLKLNNELKNIEQQKKRQKKESTPEITAEESGPFSTKRESLAEQQQRAREFDKNQSSKKKDPILLASKKSVLNDIDDESPRPTTSSKKRKSLDDIEDHEPIVAISTKDDIKANQLSRERKKAQQWKEQHLEQQGLKQKAQSPPPPPPPPQVQQPEVKESQPSKKNVLAEARAAAALAMEERLKAALPTSANKSSKKSSKKK